MTHEEMIALIEAHRDGKTIQYRPKDSELDWNEKSPLNKLFDFKHTQYRIKPEPLTAYGVVHKGELFLFRYEEQAKADVALNGGRIIKLIEEV